MQEKVINSGAGWKFGLALLFGVFLASTVASLVLASRRASPVVDTEYYSHGLHYDQTLQGSKNPGLSWTISASLSGQELQVQVKDATGAPVAGGLLLFVPQRNSAGSARALRLAESSPGSFRAPRPLSKKGELQGTLHFSKGEASASQKLVLFN